MTRGIKLRAGPEIMDIASNNKTSIMQGGALKRNAIVPMNLLNARHNGKAGTNCIDTGSWHCLHEFARPHG